MINYRFVAFFCVSLWFDGYSSNLVLGSGLFGSSSVPLSVVTFEGSLLILTQGLCTLRIPIPFGYHPCQQDIEDLAHISACIDMNTFADSSVGHMPNPARVPLSNMEWEYAQESWHHPGYHSLDPRYKILGFRDLIRGASGKVDDAFATFSCFPNEVRHQELKMPLDSRDLWFDGRSMKKVLSERFAEIEQWTRAGAFATYVSSIDHASGNPFAFKEGWLSSLLRPVVPLAHVDAPIERPVSSLVGRQFCNVMLHRTRKVYDILFAKEWKGPSERDFVYSMMYNPERILWTENEWDHPPESWNV